MRKYFIGWLMFCVLNSSALQAQTDQPNLNDRINHLLLYLPAPDGQKLDAAMEVMAALGGQGLEQMAVGLTGPGKGDNTALEYALSGFSHYVTKPGNDSLKSRTVNAYGQALSQISDKENKAFIIRQLEIVGNDDAIPFLSPYLMDERLCDPAARALVRIGSPAAKKALLNALESSSGSMQLTLVEALGDSPFKEAAPAIGKLMNSEDKKLNKLAMYTLARIGDSASIALLAGAAEKSGYRYDETGATQAYLDYAARLNAGGNPALAESIANTLLQEQKPEHKRKHKQKQKQEIEKPVPTRIAALKLLLDIQGNRAVPQLVAAMGDSNLQYRAAALAFARGFNKNEDITLWLRQLDQSPDSVKAEILHMLGDAGNTIALPAAEKALQDKNEEVRLAAIRASGKLGGIEVLPSLLNQMKSGNQGEVEAISSEIRMMKGPELTREVGNAIAGMPAGNAQVALIRILAARSADDRLYDVMPQLKNKDTIVQRAAYSALKTLVRPENLPLLFSLLSNTTDSAEIKSVQEAIVSATAGIADKRRRIVVVVSQMNRMPAKQYLFYPVLSGMGTPEALDALMSSYDNGDGHTKMEVAGILSAATGENAVAPLLQICRRSVHADYFGQTLAAYLRLTGAGNYPPEQRLLMLRNALEIAQTDQQKKEILKETGSCKTYPALLFISRYLNDSALDHEAAYAVRNIALSGDWYGDTLRQLLGKASSLLNGPDSNDEREAIRKYLDSLPAGEGFVPLFNGRDLTGWKGLVTDPIQRTKLDSSLLAKGQQFADARMRSGWYVKDGELVFSGRGDNLCSIKKYGDFEMYVDWKIHKDGDAGIYLRGSPQVQIWDTSRANVGAQVGSGGLYNNQANESKPLKVADNAVGEWNHFHIIMKGDRVTVYLNGVLVVNNTILENYWDRKQPIFPVEQIELQAHGNLVAYRDLFIREIPAQQPDTLSTEEKQDSFKILFDGTNMHEWTGNTAEYVMENGQIVVRPENGGHGNLYTKEEYSDFIYRFEFQLTPGANNGIGIRAPLEGDAAYVGMEIQVLDNEAPIYRNLHPYQYHGSVYGVIPSKRGYLKPLGEWNSEEIMVKGNQIRVTLNGTVILDGDITEASKNGTADGKDHPGLKRTGGHIGFLGHGDVVRFRKVRIKTLTE
jgi:HEAT repeat protein